MCFQCREHLVLIGMRSNSDTDFESDMKQWQAVTRYEELQKWLPPHVTVMATVTSVSYGEEVMWECQWQAIEIFKWKWPVSATNKCM